MEKKAESNFCWKKKVVTPSLNDDFSIKNEPNEIHIRTCLYVPKECRKTLKQIFYGEIFLPSKNPHICGRMWGSSAGNPTKGIKKSLFSEIFP